MIIQNVDFNVSVKDYAIGGGDQLLLFGNPFPTIQGEGPYAGQRCWFVRLAGCNKGDKASCPFCDTAFQYAKGKWWTFEMLADCLATEDGLKLLVITGGEPTMQDNLGRFIHWWYTREGAPSYEDYTIQIESNGDRPIWVPSWHQPGEAYNFELVVSPKVNPVSQEYQTIRSAVRDQVRCFKFVVSADPDSPYHRVPEWADDGGTPIYVSPMTIYKREVLLGEVANMWDPTLIDLEATRLNYAHARDLAMLNGYIVSMQKHLFLNIA